MPLDSFIVVVLGLAFAPLMSGLVYRVKAFVAGRKGRPVLQLYYDLARLFRKGAVFSKTTTWLFGFGPLIGMISAVAALLIVPFCGLKAPFAFAGDFLLFVGLLGLSRFFTVLAALDTGSSFEGMGASREIWFSALAEPAVLLGLTVAVRKSGCLSLSEMFQRISILDPEIILVAVAFWIVLLCENSRIPFDDPDTHLELTMVHEVMVLDHSGPDFACILAGSSVKLWLYGCLILGLVLPKFGASSRLNIAAGLIGMAGIALGVGMVESVMARLRLVRVSQLLAAAAALAALAFVLSLR